MKHKLLYSLPLLAVLFGFTACSSDEVENNAPQDNVVRVVANVSDMATRGSYTTETLGNMGLGIKNENSENYSYSNVLFTKGDNSVWTSLSQLLWQNETQAVDIVAYAPYKEATFSGNLCDERDFPVSVQTTQTKDDNSSDFLVFKKAGFVPKKDLATGVAAIPVVFQHALSKLTVNVTFGTEYNDIPLSQSSITGVVVGGTRTKGFCDFSEAEPIVTTDLTATQEDVNPYIVSFTPGQGNKGAVATYSCILIPQTMGDGSFSVSVTVNTTGATKEFIWVSPKIVILNANTSYSLNLTVGKDYVAAGQFTIQPWANSGTMDIETD